MLIGKCQKSQSVWADAQALHPLFRAEEDAGTRDNAAGAVGRIIATVGSQVPLEQVCCTLSGTQTHPLHRVADRIPCLPELCPT